MVTVTLLSAPQSGAAKIAIGREEKGGMIEDAGGWWFSECAG
jgi:hypothetical protein